MRQAQAILIASTWDCSFIAESHDIHGRIRSQVRLLNMTVSDLKSKVR